MNHAVRQPSYLLVQTRASVALALAVFTLIGAGLVPGSRSWPLMASASGQAPQAPQAAPAQPAPAPAAPTPEACTSDVNLLKTAKPITRGVTGWVPRVTDDTLAEEGTFWSNPDAVVVAANARFEYDLGSVKPVKALVIQGDNNDEYVIEGSLDGTTFTPIWVAPATFVGMGLRTRWVNLQHAVNARHLRVTGRGGDGFFSISELQALCKVPAVFPPKLKLPPKKYGWDAIDNDVMVNIKGVISLVAAALMIATFWRRFAQARIRAIGWRSVLIGFFGVLTLLSAWFGGLADTGTTPADIVKWARTDHSPGAFYAGAGLLAVLAIGAAVTFRIKRAQPLMAAVLISCLVLGSALLLWLGAIAANGSGLVTLVKWTKDHGSAPGFYYTSVLLFSIGMAVGFLSLRAEGPRLFDTTLAIIGVFCFYAWWNIGHYHFDHYIHIWEHYHYIMGAKYPELRYRRLYQCTAVADIQDGYKNRVQARKMRRIESDNKLGNSDEIIAHPEICTSLFPDTKRFEQFRADIRFFRSRFSLDRWDESQNDHGYNATPVWAIIGRLITERVDLTWDNIVNLGIIDSGYLIAMWLTVLWAFGWRAAAVAAIYWGCNFPARFWWNGGSFLRYDWQLWMIVGICLLRKRKHFFGGAALTYGALLRVFPGFVVAAIVLKALAAMVRERRFFLSREHQRFAAGCIVAMAVLIPTSGWATNGLDAWPEFAVNSKKHLATALTNNMGLKTVMGYDFATRAINMRNDKLDDPFQEWKDAKEYFYKTRAPLYYGLIFLFCILLARAGDREEDDWVAASLGTGLIVMAAELTCYYYGFLMTYGFLWERRKIPGILAAVLAGFTCFIYDLLSWNDDHFAAMSLASVVVVVAVTAHSAFSKRAGAEAPAKTPSKPAPSTSAAPATLPPAVPEAH